MKSQESHLQIVGIGSSTLDGFVSPGVQVRLRAAGVEFSCGQSGRKRFVATQQEPFVGGKVTATHPLCRSHFDGFLNRVASGGGIVNQASALADMAGHQGTEIAMIDTAPANTMLAAESSQRGIRLEQLGLHNPLFNLVAQCGDDKITIVSPVVLQDYAKRDLRNRSLRQQVSRADILICASTKDGSLARQLWAAANGATRHLQGTRCFDRATFEALGRKADTLCSNVAELYCLSDMFKLGHVPVEESSPQTPTAVRRVLVDLYERGVIQCRVAVITRGRHGSVVVDFDKAACYSLEIEVPSGDGVSTPSGAGDLWYAKWIVQRELCGMADLDAAEAATRYVSTRLGLSKDSYKLNLVESSLQEAAAA